MRPNCKGESLRPGPLHQNQNQNLTCLSSNSAIGDAIQVRYGFNRSLVKEIQVRPPPPPVGPTRSRTF